MKLINTDQNRQLYTERQKSIEQNLLRYRAKSIEVSKNFQNRLKLIKIYQNRLKSTKIDDMYIRRRFMTEFTKIDKMRQNRQSLTKIDKIGN